MSRRDDPRAAYIAVAARKFAEGGYRGTSLDAVAREAGVTKQALLHFFGTKGRLYAAVLADLSDRLCAGIDAAARPDPAAHLAAYFAGFVAGLRDRPDDARLVIRALLDSEPEARTWPLKPYLDRLAALIRATEGGCGLTEAEALAQAFQVIGALQYHAVAAPALAGMYGAEAAAEVAERLAQDVARGFSGES